jgi:hypothetical protein
MAKQNRLGTKEFCKNWAAAGKVASVWNTTSKKDEDRAKSFVHLFRKMSGHTKYPEALIKARIASYEEDISAATGVFAPKYPKKRSPSCVTYFSENPPPKKKEKKKK